jgi:hypothetical protein
MPPSHPETERNMSSPSKSQLTSPSPSSPYYNALTSAYINRAGNKVELVPIMVGKHNSKKQETISEQKRHKREAQAKREVAKTRKWWDHEPPLPGTECTEHQQFLADDVEHYTGVYRKRFTEPKGGTALGGDYYTTPRRCTKMLMNRSYAELNIPKRSADFRNEVTWRMKLRTNTPSEFQMQQYRRAASEMKKRDVRAANKRESVRHEVVDSVGHLLHFFLNTEGNSKKAEEEMMAHKLREMERMEQMERDRENLTQVIKKRAAFLLGPIGNHDVEAQHHSSF